MTSLATYPSESNSVQFHPSPQEWSLLRPMDLPWLERARRLTTDIEGTSLWEMDGVRWLLVGPLFPSDTSMLRREQADEVWRAAARTIECLGFAMTNVVRTWLYVDDILSWYGEFNQVRDSFFKEVGMRPGRLPASTAVGIDTSGLGAFALHVLAVQAAPGADLSVETKPSPMQGPALDYGSSFSRAIEVRSSSQCVLMVSGTASIDASGRTLHPDEKEPQIGETRRVLEALLDANGYRPADVRRAIHYGSHPESWNPLPAWLGRGLNAQVCRQDLVFEAEIDAVRPNV